jgi:hypothetical protein
MPVLKTFFSHYFVKKIASYGLDLKALHLNRMSQSTFRGNNLFEEKKCRESEQKPRFSFLYQRVRMFYTHTFVEKTCLNSF